MKTMKALRATAGETKPRLEEIPVPDVDGHDVLVRVVSAGFAPGMFSLLEMGKLKHLPMTLGHEAAGTVTEIGKDVSGFKVGDRVRLHPTMSCGHCIYCVTDRQQMCNGAAMIGFAAFGSEPVSGYERYRDGGLAEY